MTEVKGTRLPDAIYGSSEVDFLYGRFGDDYLNGAENDDRLYGGRGQDYLDAGTGNDQLYGQAGDDQLVGGGGADRLLGGMGNDTLIAWGGYSELYGGLGDDNLILGCGKAVGGAGNDVIQLFDYDDFGWTIEPGSTTEIHGGNGVDAAIITFRLGADSLVAVWDDYQPGERITFQVLNEDGTLLYDDATTKYLLDSDQDGQLTDADAGILPGFDVYFNPEQDGIDGLIKIQVDNDFLILGAIGNPVDHYSIW